MKWFRRRYFLTIAIIAGGVLLAGLLLTENLVIPVKGASRADWNHRTFWHPWGRSGVHKGIDIFAGEGTPVVAASAGIVVYTGTISGGGNIVSVLGPKWRIHYYAHLKDIQVPCWTYVSRGERIGSVGTTGNAAGTPPHLHYAIISQIPYVWRLKFEPHGIDRMFYLNPHEKLIQAND
jgi:murein DD-endopeptidase MepM/ murein hydrolase activator NlpD